MLIKSFVFSLTLALSGAVLADSKVGDEVIGQLQIGKRSFALPPGKWTVVAERESRGGQVNESVSTNDKTQYLVQIDGQSKFVSAATFSTTLSSIRVTNWNDSTCDRKDWLFTDKLDATMTHPACSFVNYSANFWGGNNPKEEFDKTILSWYRDNKVVMPYNAVFTGYRKYFSSDYVRATFWFNPELVGLIDADRKPFAQSPWTIDNIKTDSARLAYIEQVKTWNQTMVKNSKATLMDGKPIDAGLPPMPGIN